MMPRRSIPSFSMFHPSRLWRLWRIRHRRTLLVFFMLTTTALVMTVLILRQQALGGEDVVERRVETSFPSLVLDVVTKEQEEEWERVTHGRGRPEVRLQKAMREIAERQLLRALYPQPIPLSQCRMETCFNYSRCPQNAAEFAFFISPGPKDWIQPEYDEWLRELRADPRYSDDPSRACLFFVGVDTMCLHNGCRDSWTDRPKAPAISAFLKELPHWDGGRNHVLFDFCDYATPYEKGLAIMVKSSANVATLRRDFDVSFPLFPIKEITFSREERAVPATERSLLLSFKGARYKDFAPVRNHLYRLHNGKDILIITRCFLKDKIDSRCARDARIFLSGRYDYKSLLRDSRFVLAPEGVGKHSYRLVEALAAGTIPVILADNYLPPLPDVIDWSRISVHVPTHRLLDIPDFLRSLDDRTLLQMQREAIRIYERIFQPPRRRVLSALLDVLQHRIFHYAPYTSVD